MQKKILMLLSLSFMATGNEHFPPELFEVCQEAYAKEKSEGDNSRAYHCRKLDELFTRVRTQFSCSDRNYCKMHIRDQDRDFVYHLFELAKHLPGTEGIDFASKVKAKLLEVYHEAFMKEIERADSFESFELLINEMVQKASALDRDGALSDTFRCCYERVAGGYKNSLVEDIRRHVERLD